MRRDVDLAYNPNQAREDDGKFAGGGGSSSGGGESSGGKQQSKGRSSKAAAATTAAAVAVVASPKVRSVLKSAGRMAVESVGRGAARASRSVTQRGITIAKNAVIKALKLK